ncbi:MAG: 8-amino-7-oxononanoate synthase [Verrucomicrobia bacterium]|nr:8-amino-7-oxononanoate synthase [Verrucomicrobiota bacterium]
MSGFEAELNERLRAVREQALHRELRRVDSPPSARITVGGGTLLNFSSNDYLGLANHPALKEAAIRAVEKFGAGAGASRLICGSLAPHHELEAALAEFEGTAAALTFSSGYATALGVIGALVGKDDVIVLDKLVHASIVDAARLSGAKLRVFKHNDLDGLEQILRWADTRNKSSTASAKRPRTLIVTESVFSMDGDLAPLRDIARLKERHGAWLMVDEAHATGLFGARRSGLVEEFGLADQVEVRMGTLGKAVGAAGGYVCGTRALVDYLVNRARSFIFSTAPVPAAAAAAAAGVKLIQSAEGERLRTRLWALVNQLKDGLIQAGWPLPAVRSAILPLVIGGERKAMEIATALREQKIFVPAIRYPTVARGQARLRVTVTAAHTPEDIAAFTEALGRVSNLKSQIPNLKS